MPLNSIQLYVQSVLQGAQGPDAGGNLIYGQPWQVYIAPPTPGIAGYAPVVYVWGGRKVEDRWTMGGRTGGNKRLAWEIDVYCWVPDYADGPAIDQAMPVISDYMDSLFRAVKVNAGLPVPITDPVTGVESQVIDIGERMELRYFTPQALEEGSSFLMQMFSTRVRIYEWLSG